MLQNNGTVSTDRRKQFLLIVPNPIDEAIEDAVRGLDDDVGSRGQAGD